MPRLETVPTLPSGSNLLGLAKSIFLPSLADGPKPLRLVRWLPAGFSQATDRPPLAPKIVIWSIFVFFGVALVSITASRKSTRAFNGKAAKQPEDPPDMRSKSTGLYRAFLVAGLLLVGAAVFCQTLLTNKDATNEFIDPSHRSAVAALVPELAPPTREEPPKLLLAQEQAPIQALSQPAIFDTETTAPPATSPGGLGRGSILQDVNITFYDCANQGFCGAMYNGKKVYEGVAACSWNLPLGTKFAIVGDPTHRIYICEDRGILPDTWVDIFWYFPNQGYSWQGIVGRRGIIEIVSIP